MTYLRKACILALFVLAFVAEAAAQNSLYDNPNYRRSLELRRMADTSFAQGNYVKAQEYSLESERLSIQARAEAEITLQMWTANSWKRRAGERISYGERFNAAGQMGPKWTEAKDTYAAALKAYDAKQYEASTTASKQVVDLMASFTPVTLPALYTVRLIESSRDCFWRIAGYPFVYGDPWQWRRLYEANKDKIPEPNNPDLILPGMVMTIPALKGEVRSGTWAPTP